MYFLLCEIINGNLTSSAFIVALFSFQKMIKHTQRIYSERSRSKKVLPSSYHTHEKTHTHSALFLIQSIKDEFLATR